MSTANEQIQLVTSNYGKPWGRFAKRWVGCAMRTAPIDPDEILPAVEALYALSGYDNPRVVLVPSPGVLAFAGAIAAEIWSKRRTDRAFDPIAGFSGAVEVPTECRAILGATVDAVRAATSLMGPCKPAHRFDSDLLSAVLSAAYSPADNATVESLKQDVWSETRATIAEMEALSCWKEYIRDAMRDPFGGPEPTEMMSGAAGYWGEPLALALLGETEESRHAVTEAANWWRHSQAGNSWLHDTACIAAARDIHKLNLPEHRSFAAWERCEFAGGYRYLHPEFCLVCDFPACMNESRMVHPTQVRRRSLQERIASPTIVWRDGWLV